MPYFQVVSEELVAAGTLVSAADADLGAAHGALQGETGALDDTPAMFQFATFLAAASDAVSSAHGAVTALGGALREAATAYELSDDSAAQSLQVSGGG